MAKKKTEKVSPFVPVEEQPYQVPENWCWTRLGNVIDLIRGVSYEKGDAHSAKTNTDCLIMRGGNIEEGGINTEADNIYIDKSLVAPQQIVKKYDVIIVSSTGSKKVIGRAGISHNDYYDVAFGAFLMAARCKINVCKAYIAYYFQGDLYRNRIRILASGVNINNIRAEYINNTPLALPPLSEQQRIVARIESLFAKLDEAKEKAQEALESFETRKAAMLHRAFLGELTEGWRKAHDISFDAWKTVCWGDLITSIEAGKNWKAEGRPPERNEFGVVKVSSVTWGEFNELESKTCTSENQWNKNVQIHEGDFLFSRANTLQLVGNCVIAKNVSRRLMLSDKILRLTFSGAAVPEYILYFTRSDLYRQQIEQLASGNQDGMRNVSQKNMKLIEFPVALLPEQTEIVRILDAFFEQEARAKAQVEATLEAINTMKKSILSKAFRGELGTNNPTDESAEELMKRTLA